MAQRLGMFEHVVTPRVNGNADVLAASQELAGLTAKFSLLLNQSLKDANQVVASENNTAARLVG